ncbi:hypothetical protein UG54_00180 [Gordonia sihwensis]|nr:hypothetical protein UG54_00180 [Gordonia sihwensis]
MAEAFGAVEELGFPFGRQGAVEGGVEVIEFDDGLLDAVAFGFEHHRGGGGFGGVGLRALAAGKGFALAASWAVGFIVAKAHGDLLWV